MVKAIALIGISLDLFIFYSFQFRSRMKSVKHKSVDEGKGYADFSQPSDGDDAKRDALAPMDKWRRMLGLCRITMSRATVIITTSALEC
ncbi:hypothetical protein H4F38_09995 [Pectobacterium brasiliense]|uniref:hypothetical protein n=1 Tax=Pectobacterium brasiliense TaxID=180957 RepID=UPI0011B00813|nr:hypothetical protein [Pectobacterium brasiliense]MBN3098084.1 hypothetical protein [Pectobacterium brasiliense]MBN3102990.1 hypothetical protein [Pectobacterium brasiliense]MBN3164836.1 hypothetical protein [Pectobacterium brasiliense]MBN3180984.1 hypothetical protein [Pectobacterium brasiliense]